MIDLQPATRPGPPARSLGAAGDHRRSRRQPGPPGGRFTGDWGPQHLPELETAPHGITAVIVVNNNRLLSQDMRVFQQRAWDQGPTAGADRMRKFEPVDLAKAACTSAAPGFRAEFLDDSSGAALKDARRLDAATGV